MNTILLTPFVPSFSGKTVFIKFFAPWYVILLLDFAPFVQKPHPTNLNQPPFLQKINSGAATAGQWRQIGRRWQVNGPTMTLA